ncbi:hypothetical protein FA15DRAFT_687150 [Coprinopsis marcescibilis]|uniref:Protein CPL1-like domain-containing protein n=1 Tax=Coprinopsis marcescibilis TaxID=230819 RepID=A0A5C3KXF8_COPMA|nr:hypothetical protein FA15DRAFT_687150 [Coprinopsis marcescibilis]
MLLGKLSLLLTLTLLTAPVLSHKAKKDTLHRRTDPRCNPGTYLTKGQCVNCPAGTFSKEYGRSSCEPARPGYYVPTAGAKQESACQPGTYSQAAKATKCDSCPAGFMCPSSNMHSPQQCSPGRYSTGGVANCPLCPAGSFNNIHKATGCCLCPAGWFLAHGGNTNCQLCPNQTPYSDPGTNAMNKCSAKPGSYAPAKTANQGSDGKCPGSQPLPSGIPKRHLPRSNCKAGETACPVYNGFRVIDYDCLNVQSDLESCGACTAYSVNGSRSPESGRDCSAIPNVSQVRCNVGRCEISSCRRGYVLSPAGDACVSPL